MKYYVQTSGGEYILDELPSPEVKEHPDCYAILRIDVEEVHRWNQEKEIWEPIPTLDNSTILCDLER